MPDLALLNMNDSQRMALWDEHHFLTLCDGELWNEDDQTGVVMNACLANALGD